MHNQANARSTQSANKPAVRACVRSSCTKSGHVKRIPNALGHSRNLAYPTQVKYPSFTQQTRFDAAERPTLQSLQYKNSQGEQTVNASVSYDKRGLVKTETDANGKSRSYVWDALGQISEATDALGGKTTLGYDVRGNLIEVKDAKGNTHRFEYDRNDRLVKETRPLGQTIQYAYDAAGRLSKRTDPKGNQHGYTWDAAGRVTKIEHKDSAGTLLRTTVNTWDENHNLTAWTQTDHTRNDETTSATLSYDNANRKTGETVTYPGGSSLSYGSTHSAAGKQSSLTWPDGTKIEYGYSAHGELQTVSIPGEGTISVNEFNWLQPKTTTLPGGSTQNKGHDGLLNLESLNVKTAGQQSTLSLSNSYGKVQELQERSRTDTTNNVSSSQSESFEYDDEIRLTKANKDTGGLFGSSSESFTLDAVANRTAHSETPGTWQYDANNRLTKIGIGACGTANTVCYSYDEAGNLTTKTEQDKSTQYSYDSQNRLIEVRSGTVGNEALIAQYGYDPMNRRLWKLQVRDKAGQLLAQAKRTFYLYSDEGLIAEASEAVTLNPDGSISSNAAPQITAQYGPKPGNPFTTGTLFIKTKNSNGQDTIAYYHHDHLGTPIQATDKNGKVVWAARYDAFGRASIVTLQATAENPTIVSNLRLPGQYEDEETGLHYNWNRYYDPAIGRYVTEDPIGLDGGLSLYGYVNGNPTQYFDPVGLWVWGDPLPQWAVDGAAGFGDALSFNGTSLIRKMANIDAVDKCSSAYGAGTASAALFSLAWGGAHFGRHVANVGARRFFVDPRKYETVQKAWSKSVGGYKGSYELHHWFRPQSTGGTSAGWNLVPISPSLNNYMSNGGWAFSTFKYAFMHTYTAAASGIPTAIVNSNNCGCD